MNPANHGTMLTDTHTHLDDAGFSEDLGAVLARASAAGVTRLITIGTSVAGSRTAVALAESYPQVYAVVGIHPNEAMDAPEDALVQLRELAHHPRVVAIGETGLDYHYLPSRTLLNPPPWLGGGNAAQRSSGNRGRHPRRGLQIRAGDDF
ncbi:MAG: TatD family hydrolase [Chthoniobacteraceae bacterium]